MPWTNKKMWHIPKITTDHKYLKYIFEPKDIKKDNPLPPSTFNPLVVLLCLKLPILPSIWLLTNHWFGHLSKSKQENIII